MKLFKLFNLLKKFLTGLLLTLATFDGTMQAQTPDVTSEIPAAPGFMPAQFNALFQTSVENSTRLVASKQVAGAAKFRTFLSKIPETEIVAFYDSTLRPRGWFRSNLPPRLVMMVQELPEVEVHIYLYSRAEKGAVVAILTPLRSAAISLLNPALENASLQPGDSIVVLVEGLKLPVAIVPTPTLQPTTLPPTALAVDVTPELLLPAAGGGTKVASSPADIYRPPQEDYMVSWILAGLGLAFVGAGLIIRLLTKVRK